MKKATLIIVFIGLFSTCAVSQGFRTDYVRGKNSTFCGEEQYYFKFDNRVFKKTDYYSGDVYSGPSKITQTDYDNNGNYFEIRTPHFLLDEKGIGEYRRYNHYSHKIVYDKRGGDILYVYEINNDYDSNNGKYYFTAAGYELFCN